MSAVLDAALFAVVAASAARSTWSPCGLSMLSSINPVGEAGRGRCYRWTAGWYVAGAVAGGATLGAAMAVLAGLVAVAPPPPGTRLGIGAAVCALAGATDAGWLGERLPLLRRQVDERWLDRYRGWVYGAAFGWQIGVGLSTYVMSAGVLAAVALGALSSGPLTAFLAGTAFGAFRGLTVLQGASVVDAAALRVAQRRLARAEGPVRRLVVAVLLLAAVVLGASAAGAGGGWTGVGLLIAAAALVSAATVSVLRPPSQVTTTGA